MTELLLAVSTLASWLIGAGVALAFAAYGAVANRWWAPASVIALGLTIGIYDVMWGCGNPGPGERCDGAIGPFVFVLSLPVALLVGIGIGMRRAVARRRPVDPAA